MKTLLIMILVSAVVIVGGCRRGAPEATEVQVKTADEFRAEAIEQITRDNWEAELTRLEAEVEAELQLEE